MSKEEINMGDYVRLKDGRIGEICGSEENALFIELKNIGNIVPTLFAIKEDVIKSSPNIIDLIQEGDYVDGDIVIVIWGDKEVQIFGETEPKHIMTRSGEKLYNDDIKSIVTKEMFESMKYIVE